MASQIAPELEENIKEYILKTMKEVKKESNKLNKQASKEDNTMNNEQLKKEFPLSKQQTNENLMELEEEEKTPFKPSNTGLITNNFLVENKQKDEISSQSNKEKKRNSNPEFEDIKKIEALLKFFFINYQGICFIKVFFLRDIKGNNEVITNEINNILVTLVKYLESNILKYQESSLKLMRKLFVFFENYQKMIPDTISKLLNLYHLNHQVSFVKFSRKNMGFLKKGNT